MSLQPTTLYNILQNHFGIQNWWPVDINYHSQNRSDPRFEIMVGAILTQNTAWKNVEKALDQLKHSNNLSLKNIHKINDTTLKQLIQPSGFFNQKATRLKQLTDYLMQSYNGDLDQFFASDVKKLRKELVLLPGIGPETADSILLYAGNFPVFVVDAYTKRLCQRLPIEISNLSYNVVQQVFETDLLKKIPHQRCVQAYQQLHALIVEVAKQYCRIKPLCNSCPLQQHCRFHIHSL